MSFDTSWDINLCNERFSSWEEWTFKEAFLMENKYKYPKEQLLVLSNIFMNIEFENCKYPKLITDHIEKLSKRFVCHLRSLLTVPKKISATDSNAAGAKDNENTHKKIKHLTPCDRLIPGFVLVHIPMYPIRNTPYGFIKQSCSFSGMARPKIIYEPQGSHVRAKLYIQNQLIAVRKATLKTSAFELVTLAALKTLFGMCYIIKVKEYKQSRIKMLDIMNDSTIDASNYTTHHNKISENNVGYKILKNMGWKAGDGLGKNNQGITSPIETIHFKERFRPDIENYDTHTRTNKTHLREFKIQAQNYIMKFLYGPKKRLSFSTSLTEDERNIIQSICTKVGIWTKINVIQEKGQELVIVKKQTSHEIFDELINCSNFQNDYYELRPPFKFINE